LLIVVVVSFHSFHVLIHSSASFTFQRFVPARPTLLAPWRVASPAGAPHTARCARGVARRGSAAACAAAGHLQLSR
jgi:hypothetical protein